MKLSGAETYKNEPSPREIRAGLEKHGYKIMTRPFDRDEVEMDGQQIKLPFGNMSGMEVLLKNENGEWKYIAQGMGDDFENTLKAYFETGE